MIEPVKLPKWFVRLTVIARSSLTCAELIASTAGLTTTPMATAVNAKEAAGRVIRVASLLVLSQYLIRTCQTPGIGAGKVRLHDPEISSIPVIVMPGGRGR